MSIVYDAELSFVFLADSIIRYPKLQRDFEEYYKIDKYRFYERARHNKYYDHQNMIDNTLESEVAMRRIFGILLCAEDDETIRDFVCGKLLDTDRRYAELVRNPKKTTIMTFLGQKHESRATSYTLMNAPVRFLGYLLYSSFGTDTDNETVSWFLSQSHKANVKMDKYNLEGYIRHYKDFKSDNIVTPKKVRHIISRLKSGLDVCSFTDFLEKEILNVNSVNVNPELYNNIKDYYASGEDESFDVEIAMFTELIASGAMAVNGVSFVGLLGDVGITDDEHKLLIKILARSNHKTDRDFRSGQSTYRIEVSDYLTGLIFMLLVKEIDRMKEFYFRNNSETQYLELQRLESIIVDKDREIEQLRAGLAKADEQSERQREEIKRFTDEAYKENKESIRPYQSEIYELNNRIRELEKSLEKEQEKNPELNALREFVFSLQSEYIPTDSTVTLAELIQGKKIIVVGGHINWRNQMKERYPNITFLDGHNVSLDNTVLDRADLILFQTSNMSHKVYYKVIDYLRSKKIMFDYLGRSVNQRLLESEITSILQEKLYH